MQILDVKFELTETRSVFLNTTITCLNPFRVCACWLNADDDPALNKWLFSPVSSFAALCDWCFSARLWHHSVMVGKLEHEELLLVDLWLQLNLDEFKLCASQDIDPKHPHSLLEAFNGTQLLCKWKIYFYSN